MKEELGIRYPVLKEDYYIKVSGSAVQKKVLRRHIRNIYLLSDDLVKVLKLMEGIKSLNDICNILSDELKAPFDIIQKQLLQLINEFEYIEFLDKPKKRETMIIYEKPNNYPSHLDVEITNHCNFRCLYCFNESLPENKAFMDADKFISLVNKLKKNGLETVVITGGEPLTHPEIFKIVKYACNNLVAVQLNTNGYLLPHFSKLFKDFKNLDIQITLNSSTPEIHEKLSNSNIEKLHEGVIKGINIATKLGLSVTLAMNIVPENIYDIENMANLAKKLKCKQFIVSEIEVAGRANIDLYVDTESDEIQKILKNLNEKYEKGFFKNIEDKKYIDCIVRTNCGILSEFLSISAEGNIQLCTFAKDYLRLNNIFELNIDEYFKILDQLNIMKVPEPTSDLCFGCKHYDSCSHCIYKGLLMKEQIGAKCKWGESEMVNELIKNLESIKTSS
ncbi:MAG: radical SAM protein [Methanobrevibacter sp.]|jgi:MoaA/NifB/PqqE/SkfB family radical SAM enzyme|nr:radical SAM protein [Candidatus Methanovirga procula]